MLLADSTGTCTVTATKAEDSDYLSASAGPTAITIGGAAPSVPLGNRYSTAPFISGISYAAGRAGDVYVADYVGNHVVEYAVALYLATGVDSLRAGGSGWPVTQRRRFVSLSCGAGRGLADPATC